MSKGRDSVGMIGLSTVEAEKRLFKYGPNDLGVRSGVIWWRLLLSQFSSPLIYVLLFASVVTLFMREYIDAGIIFLAVMVNVVLGFSQEFKAEKSLEELSKLVSSKVKVKRDSKWIRIDSKEVVVGDLVRLSMGKVVPADGVLLAEDGMFVDESILTGESVRVEKKGFKNGDDFDFGKVKLQSKVFMGTVVERGIGEMLVVRVGKKTKMGKIAVGVSSSVKESTPLQRKLSVLSRQLAIFVGVVTVLILFVGLWVGDSFAEIFPTAVALAVAAIPEGLVVSLTVILAIGMKRILKRKALVRKLLAAETLGGVDVICADKTGTITEGKMSTVGVVTSVTTPVSKQLGGLVHQNKIKLEILIKAIVLCNDMRDPLEVSMYNWASKRMSRFGGMSVLDSWNRLDELPFDMNYKYIVTRHKDNRGSLTEFISGAPEVVLGQTGLSVKEKELWNAQFASLGEMGYRLVGFGYKKVAKTGLSSGVKIKRSGVGNYKWLGVVCFEDPVRAGVARSLSIAKKAGIDVKVITGDYKETAWSVVRQVGLAKDKLNPDAVLVGSDLAKMSDDELERKLGKIILFARTSPTQKLRIVEALQRLGHTVAMTGDGVNDAPALKRADIGVAMGDSSDVSKQAADMILLDNNFGTILAAVEEGRGIFDNLKKVLLYLLADSFAEVVLVIGAMILGWPLPLLAVQILWINLVSDGFPYLALTVEPKEKGLLKRLPIPSGERIMNTEITFLIAVVSIVAGLLTLSVFGWYYFVLGRSLDEARNVAFIALGVKTLVYVFSTRSLSKPIWRDNFFKNWWLIVAVLGGFLMLFAVMYVPVLQKMFRVMPLSLSEWGVVAGASFVVMFVIEMVKWIYIKKYES